MQVTSTNNSTQIQTHPSVIAALARTVPLTSGGKYNDYWNNDKETVICPVTGHPILRYPPPIEISPESQQITTPSKEPTGRLKALWTKIVNFFSILS